MHFSEHQIKVNQDYIQRSHDIKNEFVPDEETSFTIIAWPTPSIAERTAEDFSEEEAEALAGEISEKYSDCDVEVNAGGQPIYYCIISVE